jgi:Bax protein
LLANLPADLTDVKTIEVRKALFSQAVLPLILRANEDVAADRKRLGELARTAAWSDADAAWLGQLALRYGTDPGEIDELLRRVDVIPPSLALAQAAEESGWGTSRFAVSGNAVFGQWTFDPDQGLVPLDRNDGAQHLVRSFEGLLASVAGYMRNLNTHDAYAAFRNRRKQMRDEIGALDAMLLANTLLYYSEGRRDYVRKIRDIIERNELAAFDDARLKPDTRTN